jgi:tRNA (guanine37-N1)-methyltransferase
MKKINKKENKKILKHRAYSLFGNVAIVNFSKDFSPKQKKMFANEILKENKSVRSVLEKSENFKGRLRKMQTKWLAGEKTKEVLYTENGCRFRFNIDETYFSPRLSNERKEISSEIKKGEKVFVMFAGVAPFSIVIAKNSPAKIVYSNEINRKANKYAKFNVELNKLNNKVFILPGDIKRVSRNISEKKEVFDVIVMPRPQLKDSFLESAFMLSKKGTRIYYYDFCKIEEIDKIKEKVILDAKKFGKMIKILKVKKAGEIAPYKIRLRIDFQILN